MTWFEVSHKLKLYRGSVIHPILKTYDDKGIYLNTFYC